MPFFSDYGYYHHGSAPFSSQYYSQLIPTYSGSNSNGRSAVSRVQPRSYNSMVVEQTLRAIRRSPGAVAARHYARPVHMNTSEIDVTSPRRPAMHLTPTATEAATNDGNAGGNIHRGRTVVRLHTKNKRIVEKLPVVQDDLSETADVTAPMAEPHQPSAQCTLVVSEEGLAKKGTIKRHTSVGVKVLVNDDRRPSVSDVMLREQEALFDTMIMEELDQGQKARRKSYPADCCLDDIKKQLSRSSRGGTRKKSAGAALQVFGGGEGGGGGQPEKSACKKTNWKLNYDVIIEESGIEPVSFTFKLQQQQNKTKNVNESRLQTQDVIDNNGKLDANHNVVLESHAGSNKNNSKTKHVKKPVIKKQSNNVLLDNSNNTDCAAGGVSSVTKTKVVKKKIIVKKKVIKKKASEKQPEQKAETRSPPESKRKGSKTEGAATATAAAITPFVRTSFGKTFISPSQVSSTKSKFEKPKAGPKPEIQETTVAPPPQPPASAPPPAEHSDSSSDDDDDTSSLCSSSGSSSGSTYYDSDDYGDKRIACSVSSFDSGLPSSPVPATDPIGRKNPSTSILIIIVIDAFNTKSGFTLELLAFSVIASTNQEEVGIVGNY